LRACPAGGRSDTAAPSHDVILLDVRARQRAEFVTVVPPATEFRPQLRQPRLAELVAAALRSRILSGRLPDGSMLPKQEELIEEFKVSKPSMREALRILETEG